MGDECKDLGDIAAQVGFKEKRQGGNKGWEKIPSVLAINLSISLTLASLDPHSNPMSRTIILPFVETEVQRD